ncbi:MAG: TonB-dependent receptor plug domain-containing protein [Solimonas sp.]
MHASQAGGSAVFLLSLVSLAASQFAYAQETAGTPEPASPAQQVASVAEPAAAPESPAPEPAADASGDASGKVEEIVVTGTRIVRDGYQAPTPVTVMGIEELQSFASPNIADALNTMPELSGSQTPATSVATASTGASNINALNLRALGTNRTLVLIDGQRSVASSLSGLVDINLIPQDLVSRVEVVTGGASAAYGSDALSGVVNFVLDKKFTGLKANIQGGETTHDDGDNWSGGLTWGTPFGDGRGHFLFSGSYRYQAAIPINDRDWNLKGYQFMNNPNYTTTNGQPRRLLLDQVSPSTGFAGGVITGSHIAGTAATARSTAFRGTAFGPGGTPYQLEFGDMVSDPDMHGGDWQTTQVRGTRAGTSLLGGSKTQSFFTRGSWDLTDDINVFAQAAYSRDVNHNYAFSLEDTGGIALKVDNAFLSDNIRQAMLAQNVDTFYMGSMHTDLPIVDATNDRRLTRLVTGAEGKFGDGWSWNTYYQRGISDIDSVAKGMFYNPYLTLAYDAVLDPDSGAIVCRSTLTDPTNGCQPYNPMGIGVNTPGAVKYVTGNGEQMWRKQQLTQDVAAFTLNGTPFATWAGDVSVATGVEWRKEAITKGRNDPLSETQKWWVGGYLSSTGSYNVKEVFLESVVPLAKNLPGLEALDFSGAVRATDYSTSGNVETWKLGLNWTPIQDVRVRTTLSRDIRAPNLEELFSNGGGGAPAITNPWLNGETEYITSPRIGNSELEPEKADSFGAGFVLTPRFLPGFAVSVDYWKIEIDDAIGLPATQDIIDGCYNGQTAFCSAIDFDEDGSQQIAVVRRTPFNYTTLVARGVDYEASYRFAMRKILPDIPGMVTVRALATNYLQMASTINGVIDDTAGQNTSFGPPSWKWNASVVYSLDAFRSSLTARGTSSGVYDNDWIECSSNCPTSTTKNVTVSDNHIASSIFWDASLSYTFDIEGKQLESFINVRNITDRDPPIVAPNPGGFSYTLASSNAQLYDQLGRTFTVGLRLSF